jgi:predicted acylesterase/phospholipase RssA
MRVFFAALRSAIICIVIAGIFSPAISQTEPSESQKTTIALISSGAVSLGSYQAGFHYYETEWLKQNRNLYDVKIIAGASAGAINSMLSALALADSTCVTDTESVFYRAWLPIGLEQLKGNKDPLGVINREKMDKIADALIDSTVRKLKSSCNVNDTSALLDLVMAVTSTRVQPIEVPLSTLRIPKVKDQFVMRVIKNRNRPIQFHNVFYNNLNLPWSVLPFTHNEDKDILKGIVYASSAFPGAFPPYSNLPLYLINTYEMSTLSNQDAKSPSSLNDYLIDSLDHSKNNFSYCERDTPLLVDGGIINNEPIRLAYRLTNDGLDPSMNWKPTLTRNPDNVSDKVLFLYLNPENSIYPRKNPGTSVSNDEYLKYLLGSFSNISGASMSNELYALLEDNDKIASCVKPTKNYSIQMSAYLFNFFGFLEKSFRQFDFYLGMYDAEQFMGTLPNADKARWPVIKYYIDRSRHQKGKDGTIVSNLIVINSIAQGRQSGRKAATDTLNVRCEYLLIKTILDSIYDQLGAMDIRQPEFTLPVADTAILSLCDDNLKACFQTSVDRVWARWQSAINNREEIADTAIQRNQEKWKAILTRNPLPPRVNGTVKNWKERYSEFKAKIADEEDALIEELDNEGYSYQDIGHNFPVRSNRLKHALINDITELGFSTVSNSKFHLNQTPQKYLFWRPAVSRVLNFYFYSPKGWYWTVTYSADRYDKGGWSAGWSQLINSWDQSLFNHSYSLYLTGHVGYDGYPRKWYCLMGIESEIYGNAIMQPRLAVEALSCPLNQRTSDNFGLQITPSVTFLEFLRFGMGFRWNPSHDYNGPFFDVRNYRYYYQAGIELSHRDFQHSSKYEGIWTWSIPAAITAACFGIVLLRP